MSDVVEPEVASFRLAEDIVLTDLTIDETALGHAIRARIAWLEESAELSDPGSEVTARFANYI
jgi:hypothetical protein